jgi:hypothetical protein
MIRAGDKYAVEVITTFNRGSRHEREVATGEMDYFEDYQTAKIAADFRHVDVREWDEALTEWSFIDNTIR